MALGNHMSGLVLIYSSTRKGAPISFLFVLLRGPVVAASLDSWF